MDEQITEDLVSWADLAAKTQSGVACNCWICRGNRAFELLHEAFNDALDVTGEVEAQYYYLRDIVVNVLEDEIAQADADWHQQLAGAINVRIGE